MIARILKSVRNNEALSKEEVSFAISSILDGVWTSAQIGAFLMGLSQRGETSAEISGAAQVLRERASFISAPDGAIDCCGTGGDHSNSLNISTAVAFVVASCGVPVAKHGNRAASSKSGAADVLEEMGINLDLSPAQCEQVLRETGFCFLMAPHHHKDLKPLAALRKELGFRTIFNLLGPLVNPARTQFQLIGVFDKSFVRPMADALLQLGTQKSWVVHGSDGMDEITLSGTTYCAQIENGQISEIELSPKDFGLAQSDAQDIRGGDAAYNAAALLDLLNGEQSAYREIVLANAAASLVIAGKAETLPDGVSIASHALDHGETLKLMTTYRRFTKNQEAA
ncbi:MAG: anthranilate phosphoribosyltransferase [Alphaproteobacteria bacterium]|nr:anthranilate phosphoribosyltransferase [Alphaproteobacteria bacterium]